MKKIKLTQGKYALVDDEDYNLLNRFNWYTQKRKNGLCYAVRNYQIVTGVKRVQLRMHRMIIDCPKNKVIDHKDTDGLNNQKSNLRFVNRSVNAMNARISSLNTSGYTGINYSKRNKKWVVRIGVNLKRIYIGNYKDKEEAIKARDNAKKKYYKEII